MNSRKGSRELHKARKSRKSGNYSNDIEEESSPSFAGDSADYSHKSYKIERLSSSLSKKNRKTDDDTDDYSSDIKHKKGVTQKKKTKSESKESAEEISDEIYDDKEEDTSEHKKNRKRRKFRKKGDNQSQESMGERDSSVKKDSAKAKRKKHHEQDKSIEVPIAELLKKAQEHRTKYEEPIPLPELTTDTIYVQGKNGFSAMRLAGGNKRLRRMSDQTASSPSASNSRPIKVAIAFQKLWRSGGLVFQGLLGGMAVLHLIFMETYFDDSEEFVNNYSALSEIYASAFSFLIAMCVISTFDKFDLAHIGGKYLREINKYNVKSVLAVPLYIAAFSLHQVTSKVDDKLTLLHYNSSNITYYSASNLNDTHGGGDIEVDELKSWQRMTLSKDALAVLGWIFVSASSPEDMLLDHLTDMDKYGENVNLPM